MSMKNLLTPAGIKPLCYRSPAFSPEYMKMPAEKKTLYTLTQDAS